MQTGRLSSAEQPDLALDTILKRDAEYQYVGVQIAWEHVRDALLAQNAHALVLDYLKRNRKGEDTVAAPLRRLPV